MQAMKDAIKEIGVMQSERLNEVLRADRNWNGSPEDLKALCSSIFNTFEGLQTEKLERGRDPSESPPDAESDASSAWQSEDIQHRCGRRTVR